jgi:hypothetical protein
MPITLPREQQQWLEALERGEGLSLEEHRERIARKLQELERK